MRSGARWSGWLLVLLGLGVVVANVYVLGVAVGRSPGATPDEVRRIIAIKGAARGAIGGGLLIAGLGGALLRRRDS